MSASPLAKRSSTLTCFQYGIDLASPQELIAHEKTRSDIAKHINADDVIYQDLADLKAACTEASPDHQKITDFEVGVFCGNYQTDIPEGYFDHLNESRGTKRKATVVNGTNKVLVANSGPVNVSRTQSQSSQLRLSLTYSKVSSTPEPPALRENPENRQDIRYVFAVKFYDGALG